MKNGKKSSLKECKMAEVSLKRLVENGPDVKSRKSERMRESIFKIKS